MSSEPIVQVVEYSDKSIAVFGQTAQYKSHLMDIGGKFNPNLTHDGQKCPGWIFPKKAQASVENLVARICKGQVTAIVSSSPSQFTSGVDRKDFMALLSRVEYLEQKIGLLEGRIGLPSDKSYDAKTATEEEDSIEDESAPRPRLLKKK